MTMPVRPEQPEKAISPILVTEFGMTVFLHPKINVLDVVSIMALQLLRESYMALVESTFMLVRPEQPEKAPLPILVTEFGMTMPVRPEQPEKACSPILVTEFGMTMLVRQEHPQKDPLSILVTEFGMTMSVRCEQEVNALSPMVVTE